MFVGIETLNKVEISDFSIEGRKQIVEGAIGVLVNLQYQKEKDRVIVYIETNISEDIWNDPENDLLRQKVLRFISSKGAPLAIDIGVNQENKHIAFKLSESMSGTQFLTK